MSPALRTVVDEFYVPEAIRMADAEGLTHHTYFTTKSNRGEIIFNIGGSSPRSSTNIMALRGAISMLMEVRGVGPGRTSYKRRVIYCLQIGRVICPYYFEHEAKYEKQWTNPLIIMVMLL